MSIMTKEEVLRLDYKSATPHLQAIYNHIKDDIQIELIAEMEDIPVRGNASYSSDDELNKQCEDKIIKRLDNGDVWAWAYVRITARWNGLEGSDSLGCCSYESEKDFISCDGYYPDMVSNAIYDLLKHIDSVQLPELDVIKE